MDPSAAMALEWMRGAPTSGGSDHDLARRRGGDPASVSRRELADRHNRPSAAHPPRHRSPGIMAKRRAGGARVRSNLKARCLRAVHPGDLGAVSDVARESAVSDGARARLPGYPRSLPAHGRPMATAAGG